MAIRRSERALTWAFLLAPILWLGLATSASAQETIFSIALSGGLSGSIDEDEGGFSNSTFQARFAVETTHQRYVAVRLGRLDFDGEALGPAVDATIDYLTVSGEYMFSERGYELGLFFGLGLYDLAGDRPAGRSADQSSIGVVMGALGEFDFSERWFVYGEAAFHYANLDAAQLFIDLQIGLGLRF